MTNERRLDLNSPTVYINSNDPQERGQRMVLFPIVHPIPCMSQEWATSQSDQLCFDPKFFFKQSL